jgi:hypothetical protein
MAKQSKLEKKGFEKRPELLIRNDYQSTDPYDAKHPDALSTGDPQGKGTGHGGHTDYLPSDDAVGINYSNFDTLNGGGQYDIEGRDGVGGRKWAMARSLYNQDNAYGLNSVDTTQNVIAGQVVIN